jgi:acyl carrier protein
VDVDDLQTGVSPREMRARVEPHVRRVVADHLAVDHHTLGDSVSIRDDLAADSLDLVELALLLEGEFGVSVPDRLVAAMRSYGDVVDGVLRLVVARAAGPGPLWTPRLERVS